VSQLFADPVAIWAAILIVVLPILILAGGEAEERLRQRSSPLTRPVANLRTWVLGLVTLWVVLVLVFDIATDSIVVRATSTAIVVAVVAVIFQVVDYLIEGARERSRLPGARGIPQLLLLLPRILILLVAGWLIFASIWNVDLTGLFAALGVTSLVVSLALQPTLSSLASGLLLVSDRPFSPGDWIKYGDIEGQVVDVSWRTSRIQDRNGNIRIIPNSALADGSIINFALPNRVHRVVVPVQVAYSNPPTSAKQMLLAAARGTPGVLDEPAPRIRVVQIDDPLMGYEADLWIEDHAIAPRVFSDFGSLVWYQSYRMDVPLPSPAYDLYHHDPIQEAADAEVTEDEMLERIRRSPLLRDLPEADLRMAAAASRTERYAQGEVIVAGGSGDSDARVIWQGQARIVNVDDPTRFVDLHDGDVFGLLTATGRSGHWYDLVAVSDCEIVTLESEAVGALASRHPDVAATFNRIGDSRARRLDPTETTADLNAEVTARSISLPDGDGAPAADDGSDS